MERWSGKVALVTGASSGIGWAITEALVKNGMKVVGLARRVEKIEELKKTLQNEKGTLYPLKGDVSKEEDVVKTFEYIKKQFKTIHVLVNNAGIARIGSLIDGNHHHWKEVFDVNVLGLSLCTKMACQLMKESGVDDGHIIHINSSLGHEIIQFPLPVLNVYPSSKWAVTALTEMLRQELRFNKSKIRVTSISPGQTKTELGEAAQKGSGITIDRATMEKFASDPVLEGEDIAEAVVYVLSTPPHVQVHELLIKPTGGL